MVLQGWNFGQLTTFFVGVFGDLVFTMVQWSCEALVGAMLCSGCLARKVFLVYLRVPMPFLGHWWFFVRYLYF